VHLQEGGLALALQRLTEGTEEVFRVCCTFEQEGEMAVGEDRAAHLYRIVQEAINNAIKHAHARTITVRWTETERAHTLCVRDDGRGIPSAHVEGHSGDGMGLRIMRYRAQLIGASLHIEAGAEQGTAVTCTLPR
jgi:signal transduction histidine kinase